MKILNNSRIISIATLIISSFILLFSYKQYDGFIDINDKYTKMKESTETELDNYIFSLINENIEKAELYTGAITNKISDDIKNEYGNSLYGLEYDIDNPSENSKLTEIFDENLEEVYINKNSNRNKVFVMSEKNILWDRSLGYTIKNKDYLSIEDFIEGHYNKNLSRKAINSILEIDAESEEFIFWEVFPNSNKKHEKVTTLDSSKLVDIYNKEGLNGIKSYSILVPTYISKDGDIFGNKDISSLGFENKNYKIIVVQRLNIYDILQDDFYRIQYYENKINDLNDEILEINNKKMFNMLESVGWLIIILAASAILQKRSNDDNRNE